MGSAALRGEWGGWGHRAGAESTGQQLLDSAFFNSCHLSASNRECAWAGAFQGLAAVR